MARYIYHDSSCGVCKPDDALRGPHLVCNAAINSIPYNWVLLPPGNSQ